MTGRSRVLSAALLLLLSSCAGLRSRQNPPQGAQPRETPHTFVYVAGAAGDIDVLELDPAVGDLTRRGKAALGSPILSLAGQPAGHLLLAATDSRSGGTGADANKRASVVSLSVDPRAGTLRSRGRAGLGGSEPMGAAVDGSGRYVAVANHASGNVSIVPIRPDGSLAEADTFVAGKGASAVGFHPSNTVAFVVNEGAGTISQFSFNAGTGALTPKPGPPLGLPWDSHPRQVRCHPDGRFVYVLNEANQTVSVHTFDDRLGTLTRMAFQVASTVPEGTAGKGRTGSMRLSPGGKYLYASNREQHSVALFAIDAETGGLTARGHVASGGQDPVELVVDPEGRYLVVANQKSRSLAVFRIGETGDLTAAGSLSLASAPQALLALQPTLDDAGVSAEPAKPEQALLPPP
jgi:6-phosphogluconolactonase